MSQYSSQNVLNMSLSRRGDPTTGGSFRYTRSEFVQGGGNGYDHYMDGYNTLPKSSVGGMAVDTIGRMSSTTGGGISGLNDIHQRAMSLQAQCQEDLRRAEFALQSGGNMADAEQYLLRAKDTIDQLKTYAMDLKQMGQPSDNVFRTWEICNDQLKGFHLAMTGSLQRRKSARGSTSSWEEQGRSFHDAVAWIAQQKRLIETTFWGEDPASIEKNLISHQRFHNSIQNSAEVDRARSELVKKGDKGNLHALDQEWDSLQQMSFARTQQLEDLQQIIQELSKEIMWVNDKEEEELIFDWGDKNLDQYIPRKQESYSKLMSALEEKEKQLNKLKVRVDSLLKNNHPASDKIEAYRDTLQTQWSWLLQITKCIDVHLKENAAYNQFFKEAHETCRSLQGQQEAILQRFSCDKNTSLENLLELLKGLERERETINDHKRQVQHLVNKSKSIVRLKARNPEERSSRPVIVKALCDFKRDQRVICKGDEAILKDNSQRSKWEVTGPGGLDMVVPSVCLILPPPNPLSINLATKNEQYYESILSIWNQLYINVKSLIAWQYCLIDIQHINSLTISMLAQMSPEEYSQLIKRLETHYEEFKLSCQGSQMFVENDKRSIENLFNGAQAHYGTLVVQLPAYQAQQAQQQLIIMTTAANDDARKLEEENQRTELKKVKKEVVKVIRTEPTKKKVTPSSHSLTELHALRLKLEAVEGLLNQHVHFCLGDDGTKDCGLKITQLEGVQLEVNTIKEEYVILRENIMKELERMKDSDKAQFLRNELGVINERFNSLESNSSTNLHRLQALKDLMESMARAEDIIKVHEARLTEKETTSLLPGDVNDYLTALKNIQDELDQKNDVLASLEAELAKANHWNGEVGGPFHRCDMILSKYSEQVGLLLDRWRRIKAQINCRLQDLQRYLPQLEQYKQSSSSFTDWMDDTRKKQDYLQATNIQTVQSLTDQINNQKAINAEIKAKRETLESVLKDNEACVSSIKDFESDLACYTSGLETLLNIPIKRTMLRSPSVDLIQEATQLQTRYMELLTWSDDHLKFLGELLKNMEDLKIRSTRIDLLEEELRLLRETIEDRNSKNKSLEEAILRYQLELSQSQEKLLSMEEIKQTTDLQCNAAKDSLDSTHNQLADLTDQVTHLNYLLEEEKRKRKLAEERFTQQQEEYQSVLKKRHTELESVSRSKVEVEKTMANQEHGIKQLQRKLEEETSKVTELRNEISKVRNQFNAKITSIKLNYESQIHVSQTTIQRLTAERENDTSELQLQYTRMQADGRVMEEEIRRLKMSIKQMEELKKRAEDEAHRQLLLNSEEGHKKSELKNEIEVLIKQREEENNKYTEEMAEVKQELQMKTEQLAYVTHSLEEAVRRRKTTEEGKGVLEKTLTELQTKLNTSAMAVIQLTECEAELQKLRLELERENRDRSRVEENLNRLQGRIKDIQFVRDGLEIQLANLREANQEEVSKRRQMEIELEKTTMAMREYYCTITTLRQNQEKANESEIICEKQCFVLQEQLERSLKQNKTFEEHLAQLTTELKAMHLQVLQEQANVIEVTQKNEGLYKTIKEKSQTLNENYAELQTLKEKTETLMTEKMRLEQELRATQCDKAKLLRSKQEHDDELSCQITALELQLQASERSNLDYRNLVPEISLERDNLKLETEKIQIQAAETSTTILSLQSQYSDIVKERDALQLKLQLSGNDKDHLERLEEELRRIKLSLESELQNRQRVQEENERVKRDLSYWKEQYESKQELVNKYDANKEHLESENTSLKSEIERLLRKLSDLESTYQGKLSGLQKELTELIIVKQTMQDELKKTREPSTLNASTIIFDGVRKTVTAAQLLDCGILDEPTYNQLIKGQKTVPDVSNNIKVSLKGTGPIAGVIVEKLQDDRFISGIPCKISLTEAKKECLLPPEVVDLLLDAQAATGHIIDPRTNQNLTVEEAVADGVVDSRDQDRLLAAQAAAVGYKHPSKATPLSVCEALKNGMIDMKTGLRLLQAQECVGGILDPNLSVFLPKVMAINRNILDENLFHSLTLNPKCYIDPETDQDVSYGLLKQRCKTEAHTGLLLLPVTERKDASKLIFDGVRKPVTAQQLHDCGVLDKFSLNQLTKGQKTVPQLSDDLKVFLKGIGPIAGVTVGSLGTISISEAKRQLLMSPLSADLLLDAQAATGHIIDPSTNQRFTVEEACARGLVDTKDRDRLIVAESAAVGYRDPNSAIPLSIFEAMNKGLVDRKTGLRLLQAQASAGGILDPIQSVFLPTDTAMNRNLLDEDLCNVLNRNTECYLDPDTEWDVSYEALKKKCKTDFKTGLLILPINERKDPSKLMFEGVRKSVSAKHLFECGVLDKRTFDQLVKGEKTVSEVSAEKVVNLKGTGPIAGVQAGHQGNISLSEAKKQRLLTPVTADLLLEAQAATGYIIDPITHQKLTVNEACAKGVVDIKDRDNLLAAEAAAIGYKDPSTDKLLSVYEAMKRGLVDWKTCLRFLQAQDCVGGIIDPNFGVFLPKDIAIKRNLLDEDLHNSLSLNPTYYLNPEPELDISYGALKQKCKTEFHTGLQILPISEKMDPSNVIFEGVRRSVTAQQLFDSGILDEPTLNQLLKGEKTVGELSVEKQVYLKGTGVIAGVAAGSLKKMSFTEAKKQSIMSPESADLLLEAQAATGHIIDPLTNQKLTVKEACARGVVSREDESKLFAAEAAAIGYRDLDTSMILSVGQAMKRGLIDKETALRLLQAQESAGGILHPVLSVYLPRDVAIDRNLIDKELYEALSQYPQCYLDPDTQLPVSYLSLKQRCREDISTGLLLLPEPKKPTTVQGLRSQVSVTDLLNAKLLEPSDIDQLKEGRLTSQDIEHRLRSYLGRSTCIAGLFDETSDKVMTFYEAMKNGLLRPETALELLEAQAASGFIVDPVKNVHLTVSDAYNKGLFGSEYLDTLLSAERAVTGYKLPGTGKVISLFQAIKRGLVAKEQGIRLLQAQIASGGIIDPEHSHRIDVNVAYSKGHLDEEMNKIVMDQDVASKVFSDPKTEEKLNYSDLKKRCITNGKTGLLLLPIVDKEKQEATMKNTLRKRRVIIVDPQTNKEMTIREAYDKGYIDHTTYLELAEQECEWEEITTTAPDGSKRFVIIDKKTGREYDISELLEKRVIDQSLLDQYRARKITLTQFADVITEKTEHRWPTSTSTSHASLTASTSSSSTVISRSTSLTKVSTTMPPTIKEQSFTSSTGSQDSSETFNKTSSVSITLTPVESVSEKYPVGAIFDTETLEKISVMAALNCGLLDAITAQRLLEAQACTGGIINPENGRRLSIQEASRKGIINDDMAAKLKPAQKAFIGYEDLKMGKKMSAAEAVKEMWLPYEAGQRFMEFQFVTGGLYDPELGCRRTTADALKMGWIDNSTAMKLQDFRQHPRILTCPKSKLKISYKEALDNCMVEESTGLRMLPASSVSSRGISSPYNFGSAPGSITGSRSGSRRSSRRSSLDLGSASSLSTSHHSHSSLASFSTRSETNQK
ncbi:desmoplakin-B-like isoform X1 [Corythoichthys intestinalis]|uniref:desmoplakin-B-like isoform X1 n=1 Tax=Corythoichthys intestinalis TaxID=161448 RepID=UPI0025A558E3|nr:desmoplakin-B-like isoform X1 [Corythoichthys intestinalis]